MSQYDNLVGSTVVDAAGRALGRIESLLVDPVSLDARWLGVMLGSGTLAVVPVAAASADGEGRVTIPYGEADLASAPAVAGTVVTARAAAALLEHYGFPPEDR